MNRRVLLLGLCALLLAALGGCMGGLKHPPVEKRHFDLQVKRGEAKPPRAGGPTLAVRRVMVSPRYDGREMVYRTGPTDFSSDFYNLYFVSPSQMLGQDLRQWLAQSGVFGHVLDSATLVRPDLTLETNAAVFCGDYSMKPGKAVVEMQFLLLDERDPDTPVIFSRDYRREEPLTGGEPRDLVEGLRRAVAGIYGDLENDLRALPALR